MNTVVWVAGATASGKDSIIDEVFEPLGYMSIKTSSMLRRAIPLFYEWFSSDVDALLPKQLNELGTGIREVHGQDFFTQLAIHEDIPWTQRVINGIRRWEEFDAIHDNNGRVILIISEVEASIDRALTVRQRPIDVESGQESLRQHIVREKEELDWLSEKADLILINNFSTKEDFIVYAREKILDLLKK